MDEFNPIDVNPFDSWGPLVETGYTYFPSSPMSPFEMFQPFDVFDEYVNAEAFNTTPPLPLVVEPLGAIMPFTPSGEYVMNDDTTLSATPPLPLVVEPLQVIVPSTASDEYVMNDVDNNNGTTPLPLVVEPLGAIQPFTTSEEDFNDETSNSATPPIPLDSHTGAIILYVGSNHKSCVPAADSNPSPVPEIKRRRGRPKGSKNKRKPLVPSLEAQVGAMAYIGSNANTPVAANADADPTTVPVLEKRRGRPKGSPNSKTSNKKPKIVDPARRFVESCPNFNSEITDAERANGNQELVDWVLMRFDAVRRRFSQLGDVKCLAHSAYTNCNRLGVRTNKKRRIGPVPGVEVGDIFYGWGEMNLVGLHLATVAGIDYLTEKDAAPEGGVATSVVTAGRYDDETEDVNCLVYTGHGGKDKNGFPCDQKLERGNLAMKTSHQKGNDVRVIRGVPDPRNLEEKIYIYDGLYKVVGFDKVKNQDGFARFKFTLVRKPDQPSAYAIWKEVAKWKTIGLHARKGFVLGDLSKGYETLPIAVFNEVDDNKRVPGDFNYTSSIQNLNLDSTNPPVINCKCKGGQSCSSDNLNCVCVRVNGGDLPYRGQILICRRPIVHECGDLCPCSRNCINRVVQNGLKLSLEVYKTSTCGWGVRCREPIRAGTFICEFAGLSTVGEAMEGDGYLFDTSRAYQRFKWNFEPELTGEDIWDPVPEVFNLTSHKVINAEQFGNIGRFFNHSCDANLFWQPVAMVRNGEMHTYIALFAKKHIPPLTELRYDYGLSLETEAIGEDGARKFKGKKTCLCGYVKCRGTYG